MKLNILGKTITITDKKARAYEKMTGFPIDEQNIRIYIQVANKISNQKDVLQRIRTESENRLAAIVNREIEAEIRDCAGNKFYEEA